ncbi:hypothetical protein [Neobacillus sp.]|uniref:hypothetical protein n=1 Tax=Neobacillus sp. TaxID=2675273 RepID=UPI0035B53BDD
MIEYKYKDFEKVEAKKDFKVYKHDENGKITDFLIIKKGTKGVIKSIKCSSVNNFAITYDVCVKQDGSDIDICVYEGSMERLFYLS